MRPIPLSSFSTARQPAIYPSSYQVIPSLEARSFLSKVKGIQSAIEIDKLHSSRNLFRPFSFDQSQPIYNLSVNQLRSNKLGIYLLSAYLVGF